MDTLPKKLLVVVWATWLSLLVATPYYSVDPYRGALFSKSYAYAALGLLVGCLVFWWLRGHVGELMRSRVVSASSVVGLIGSLAVVIPEWVGLPAYVSVGPDAVFSTAGHSAIAANGSAVIALGALSCALLGLQLADGPEVECAEGACASPTCSPRAAQLVVAIAPAALFAFGFIRVMAWSPFLPFRYPLAKTLDIHLEAPLAAAPVPLLITVAGALVGALLVRGFGTRLVEGPRERSHFAGWLIAALGSGMLCWNLLTRVAAVVGGVPLTVAAALLTLEIVAIGSGAWGALRVLGRRPRGEGGAGSPELDEASRATRAAVASSWGKQGECDSSRAMTASLELQGLTSREAAAVVMMLAGKTSAESAREMGLQASTVRSYLQRAYKKLGVEDGKQLATVLPRQGARSPVIPEEVQYAEDGFSVEARTVVALGGMLASVVMLLVPHFVMHPAWGVARGMVMGGAAGMMAAGALGMFCLWLAFVGIPQQRNSRSQGDVARASLLAGGFAVSGLGVTLCMMRIAAGTYPPDIAFQILLACASFAFFALLCAGVVGTWVSVHERLRHAGTAMIGAVALALCLVVASYVSPAWWSVVASAGIVGAAMALYLLVRDGYSREGDCMRKPSVYLAAPAACSCLAFGVAAEELWRSQSLFGLVNASTLFLAVVLVIGLVYAWCFGSFLFRLASLAALPIVALGALADLLVVALFVAALLQMTLILALALHRNVLGISDVLVCFVAGGAGCAAGMVVVDVCGDYLRAGDVILESFGGLEALREQMSFVAGALFLVGGLVFLLLCRRLSVEFEVRRLLADMPSDANGRLLLYLKGRGLNDTQARVLVEVARGCSSAQISEKLNFSRGTVNTSRDRGYRLLMVRSRAQLVSLLQRDAGL